MNSEARRDNVALLWLPLVIIGMTSSHWSWAMARYAMLPASCLSVPERSGPMPLRTLTVPRLGSGSLLSWQVCQIWRGDSSHRRLQMLVLVGLVVFARSKRR